MRARGWAVALPVYGLWSWELLRPVSLPHKVAHAVLLELGAFIRDSILVLVTTPFWGREKKSIPSARVFRRAYGAILRGLRHALPVVRC